MAEHTRVIPLFLLLVCTALIIPVPAHAFTANSLDITVNANGDATAVFRFTLEGLIENAIPQSVLEEQLVKGLATSSEPPQLISMDRSSATILMKHFADVKDVPTGTEYQTGSMDFKKADLALKESAVSSVITADFTPSTVSVTFPDGYARSFSNVDALPAISHTVIDPAKAAAAAAAATTGTIKVSGTPAGAELWLDGTYVGNVPGTFDGIAPGSHELQFRKEGFSPVSRQVSVTSGKTLQVQVALAYIPTTAPTPASPGFGSLSAAIAIAAGCVLVCLGRRREG